MLVFGDSSVLAQPHLLVSPASGGGVDFSAGAVHGLTEGSVFDVYPPDTKRFGGETQPIARVRVTRVGSFIAAGDVVDGRPVEESSRAVEREHAFGDERIRVRFEDLRRSSTLQAVRDRVVRATNVQEHTEEHGYTILLRETGSNIVIEAPDGVPLSPPVSTRSDDAAQRVARNVEEWARRPGWPSSWRCRAAALRTRASCARATR